MVLMRKRIRCQSGFNTISKLTFEFARCVVKSIAEGEMVSVMLSKVLFTVFLKY